MKVKHVSIQELRMVTLLFKSESRIHKIAGEKWIDFIFAADMCLKEKQRETRRKRGGKVVVVFFKSFSLSNLKEVYFIDLFFLKLTSEGKPFLPTSQI